MILLVLACPTAADAKNRACASPLGAAVPDIRTARAIAEAIIAAHPGPTKRDGYVLHVQRDGDSGWSAAQSPPPPSDRGERMVATFGGGGLRMHIDRCSGRISDMYYLR